MKDLLQDLDISDQALPGPRGFLEEALRSLPVGMRAADEIHGDVRIDEDHSRILP